MNVIIQWSKNNILQQGYFLDDKLLLKITQNAVFSWGKILICRELSTALILLSFSTNYRVYLGWINVLTILAYVISRVRRYLSCCLNQKMFHIQRQILVVAKVRKLSRYHYWKHIKHNTRITLDEQLPLNGKWQFFRI